MQEGDTNLGEWYLTLCGITKGRFLMRNAQVETAPEHRFTSQFFLLSGLYLISP